MKLVRARLPDNENGPPDYLVNVAVGKPAVLLTRLDKADRVGEVQRIPEDSHVCLYDLKAHEFIGVWCGKSREVEQPGSIGGRPVHVSSGGYCLCPHSGKREQIQC